MFLRRFTKPKANISIVLDKYNLRFWEELTVVVRVKAEEEFDAEEIRVSTLCVKGVITVKKRPDVTSKMINFNVIDRTRSCS